MFYRFEMLDVVFALFIRFAVIIDEQIALTCPRLF